MLARWVENSCFQNFTGEIFFQHRPPIHPSSLSRWRSRIGEKDVEWLLTKTIEAGRSSGAVQERSLAEIAVDTTVVEKAIAHPTDSRLYEKARRSLVALAGKAGTPCGRTITAQPRARRPGSGGTPMPGSSVACARRCAR